jgi:autotransporter passenger strand-loop-strand repeat protein
MTTYTAPPNQNELVLNDGDILNVNSGGEANLTSLNDGAILNVNVGGATNRMQIDGGVENVMGTDTGSVLGRNGVENVLSGGSTNSLDFEGGTLMLVDPNGLSSQDPGSVWQNLSQPVCIDFKNMVVSGATMSVGPEDGFLTVNISGHEYDYEFFIPTSSGNIPVQLASDGNGGTLLSFVGPQSILSSPPFSPETAGTNGLHCRVRITTERD